MTLSLPTQYFVKTMISNNTIIANKPKMKHLSGCKPCLSKFQGRERKAIDKKNRRKFNRAVRKSLWIKHKPAVQIGFLLNSQYWLVLLDYTILIFSRSAGAFFDFALRPHSQMVVSDVMLYCSLNNPTCQSGQVVLVRTVRRSIQAPERPWKRKFQGTNKKKII